MGRFERWARQSGRLRLVPGVFLAGLFSWLAACGGGGQPDVQPPPPPMPDFALVFSNSTVTVAQGGTSNAVNVSITPVNGAGSDGRRNTCMEFTRRSLEA